MDEAYLNNIKADLKAKGITRSDLARWTGRSVSWVGTCLNGHYPYRDAAMSGKAMFPAYLTDILRRFNVIGGIS